MCPRAALGFWKKTSVVAFDSIALGTLPTHAGLVWTDGGSNGTGAVGTFRVEAFDASNISIGQVMALFGDGLNKGHTAEDRFIGFVSLAGIARLELRNLSSNSQAYVEADHVQYGVVPEPSTALLLASGLAALAVGRRQGAVATRRAIRSP